MITFGKLARQPNQEGVELFYIVADGVIEVKRAGIL